MNWIKPNFTQWVAIVTTTIALLGYIWRGENERIDSKIKQHDLEQKIDSIGNQLNIVATRFEELRKNREITLKANAEKDKALDERIDTEVLNENILNTEFNDFKEYYKTKK